MFGVYKKEINLFFSSLIGYITIGVFLVLVGLFIWVFPETNILNYGYASLDQLFAIAPNVFLLLIPAITMRSFAEETQTGTIELLATKPLSDWQIILGKYFACLTLVVIALLPTIIYYISVYKLGNPVGIIDSGGYWGSMVGLLFLGATYVGIGIFASSLTNNQIIAFIIAIALCYMLFIGFDFLSSFAFFRGGLDDFIQRIGMNYHYNSLSRGLLDTRDIMYFISAIIAFLGLTKLVQESRKW